MSEYRFLLRDTEAAVEWLEDEDDHQRRRILYAAVMGLLYSISDVLDRDGAKHVRQAIQKARCRWKSESEAGQFNWFYDFIRPERTRVVHEGRHSHSDDTPIFLIVAQSNEVADLEEDYSDVYWPTELEKLSGQDVRDVLKKALDWWVAELRIMGLDT
ncbi:hypothetical protein [Yoonia sp.]|jgi:hypothetical protein|uniref:hypothetical protein n=1 Tax=Yoonia sp. TaxID=2212373 RepID=UPI0025DC9EF7|nr:hypothetical protein [Yoonia sp.]